MFTVFTTERYTLSGLCRSNGKEGMKSGSNSGEKRFLLVKANGSLVYTGLLVQRGVIQAYVG